jgi:methionine-rich copper-binding protein CopC
VAVLLVIGLAVPASVAAHAELESSRPADGASVPSTFEGPILMTFTEALADGSKADLVAADGSVVASATVDGPAATMTITLAASLAPGTYEVQWVGVADDGHLERGTFSFTVEAPVATPSATVEPTPEPSTTPEPTFAASATPAPSAGPTPDASETAGTGDVLLPIVAGLLVVAAGGAYLLTRRRSGAAR